MSLLASTALYACRQANSVTRISCIAAAGHGWAAGASLFAALHSGGSGRGAVEGQVWQPQLRVAGRGWGWGSWWKVVQSGVGGVGGAQGRVKFGATAVPFRRGSTRQICRALGRSLQRGVWRGLWSESASGMVQSRCSGVRVRRGKAKSSSQQGRGGRSASAGCGLGLLAACQHGMLTCARACPAGCCGWAGRRAPPAPPCLLQP